MTYAFVQDVPIGVDVYNEIVAALGGHKPDGLIVHLAQVMPDGRLRYFDVWESEADCERFTEERLHPAVGAVLARHQIHPNGEPPKHTVSVTHVWK